MKTIYSLPMEGGCPKGRGGEGERAQSQPPALRATSFQRKEGKAVKAIYPFRLEREVAKTYLPPSKGRREKR